MKDKKWIWILIAVAVVVGVLASIITANFTGNLIAPPASPSSGATYQGVLNMMHSCVLIYANSSDFGVPPNLHTCDAFCDRGGVDRTCVSAEKFVRSTAGDNPPQYYSYTAACSESYTGSSELMSVTCTCCSSQLPSNS